MPRKLVPMVLAVIAATGCSDPVDPAGSDAAWAAPSPLFSGTAFEASAPAYGDAIQELLEGAFSYLQPLPRQSWSGVFDGSVLPALALRTCPAHGCDDGVIAELTSSGSPAAGTIRLDADGEHFIVNWRPADLGLSSPGEYRLSVAAAGLELGFVDVQLFANAGAMRNATTGETVTLVENRTLPVRFTVRRNVLVTAWLATAAGSSAHEVADAIVDEFGSDVGAVALLLAITGFDAAAVADVLRVKFELTAAAAVAVLLDAGLIQGDGDAAGGLAGGGYGFDEIAAVLHDVFGVSPAEAVALLQGAGATAFDIAAALVSTFGENVEGAAGLLRDGGYDAATVFDAIYRAGAEVLGNPADFALNVAVATMNGLGYALDDFKAGLREFAQDQLIDALGLSGYAMSDIVPFVLDLFDVSATYLMERAAGWGVGLPDIASALLDAGVAAGDVVAGAIAAYDATAAAVGEILVDAGLSALEVGAAVMDGFGQTIEEMAATLQALGFGPDVVFGTVYDMLATVLENPPGFALDVALATMNGLGASLSSFSEAIRDRVGDWTDEYLVEALGLAGFELADIADVTIRVLGMTTERVVDLLERSGVPASDILRALDQAGVDPAQVLGAVQAVFEFTADEMAGLMAEAGLRLDRYGNRFVEAYGVTEEFAAGAFRRAGYRVEQVGDWAWARAGAFAHRAAAIMRYAGYGADEVADFLVNRVGSTAGVAFSALRDAGYTAQQTARAIRDRTTTSIVTLAGWLRTGFGLGLEATLDIVHDLGGSLSAMVDVMFSVFDAGLDTALQVLVNYGFTVAEIMAAWP